MLANISDANVQLEGTNVSLKPRGRGYVFVTDVGFYPLSDFTTKRISALTVETLVRFGKQIAKGKVPCKEAKPFVAETDTAEKTYTIETKEISAGWNDSGFRFRIVCSDGRFSGWAPYDRVAFLDDTAALTPYYLGEAHARMMPLAEAMTHIAIGEHAGPTSELEFENDDAVEDEDDAVEDEDDAVEDEPAPALRAEDVDPTDWIELTRFLSSSELDSHGDLIQLSIPKLKMFAEQNNIDVSACATVHEHALVMLKFLTPNAVREFAQANTIQPDPTVWFVAVTLADEIIPNDVQRLAKQFAVKTIDDVGNPIAASYIIQDVLNKYGLDALVEAMQKLNIEIKFDLEYNRARLANTAASDATFH